MKNISIVLVFFLAFACNSEDAFDCFQSSGDSIMVNYNLDAFNKITVMPRCKLFVSEGEFSVILETGENLVNDINIRVSNNRLIIENNNSCNLGRDYGITKIYVTAPNLNEIRNSSGLTITSLNTLSYDNLTLLSEDLEEEDSFYTNGDFELDLNVENLTITQNNLSNFFLSGNVEHLDLNFLFGDARFEGRNLIVQNADVFHRGTNDIIINPQLEVRGSLLSTGNMIIINTPPIVNVEELYTGRVIFED
ncbi:hypothetical protein BWZ20_00940 [Winogradskyella sp. J14-2]|uniref:head GIN domain-containing protein n=1 Tax=Winogradskyella sp. J14-2 TaxID=1936080 RepID=UPI000972AD27|nr:head GIN domain-containing protein [Winogradskyella sp. J14-2]APY06949.1 hypothetical protein BWZ20_00940 [Winogradskyella sp. J14-2]